MEFRLKYRLKFRINPLFLEVLMFCSTKSQL